MIFTTEASAYEAPEAGSKSLHLRGTEEAFIRKQKKSEDVFWIRVAKVGFILGAIALISLGVAYRIFHSKRGEMKVLPSSEFEVVDDVGGSKDFVKSLQLTAKPSQQPVLWSSNQPTLPHTEDSPSQIFHSSEIASFPVQHTTLAPSSPPLDKLSNGQAFLPTSFPTSFSGYSREGRLHGETCNENSDCKSGKCGLEYVFYSHARTQAPSQICCPEHKHIWFGNAYGHVCSIYSHTTPTPTPTPIHTYQLDARFSNSNPPIQNPLPEPSSPLTRKSSRQPTPLPTPKPTPMPTAKVVKDKPVTADKPTKIPSQVALLSRPTRTLSMEDALDEDALKSASSEGIGLNIVGERYFTTVTMRLLRQEFLDEDEVAVLEDVAQTFIAELMSSKGGMPFEVEVVANGVSFLSQFMDETYGHLLLKIGIAGIVWGDAPISFSFRNTVLGSFVFNFGDFSSELKKAFESIPKEERGRLAVKLNGKKHKMEESEVRIFVETTRNAINDAITAPDGIQVQVKKIEVVSQAFEGDGLKDAEGGLIIELSILGLVSRTSLEQPFSLTSAAVMAFDIGFSNIALALNKNEAFVPSSRSSASSQSTGLSNSIDLAQISVCTISGEKRYKALLADEFDQTTYEYLDGLNVFEINRSMQMAFSRFSEDESIQTFGANGEFTDTVSAIARACFAFWSESRGGSDEASPMSLRGVHGSDLQDQLMLSLSLVAFEGMELGEGLEKASDILEKIEDSVPAEYQHPLLSLFAFTYTRDEHSSLFIGDGYLRYLESIPGYESVPFEIALEAKLASAIGDYLQASRLGVDSSIPSDANEDNRDYVHRTLFSEALSAYFISHPDGGKKRGEELCGHYLAYTRSTGEACASKLSQSGISSEQKECAAIWAVRWAQKDYAVSKNSYRSGVSSLERLLDRFDARYDGIMAVDRETTCPPLDKIFDCML